MTLDPLFTDLASRGWLINNLYQSQPDLWRVNVRRPGPSGDWFTSWAEGPTLEEALEDCMSKLNDAEFTPEGAIQHSPAPNLAEVLGLVAKPGKIRRR